jgi:hypothetical protein
LDTRIAGRVVNAEEAEVRVDATTLLEGWGSCDDHGHGQSEDCLNGNHFECCDEAERAGCWKDVGSC